MDEEEQITFSSPQEAIKFWKEKYLSKKQEHADLEEEFQDFQESSRELEQEMEKNLEKTEKQLQDMTTKYKRLQSEYEMSNEKSTRNAQDTGKMINDLQNQLDHLEKMNKQLLEEKRTLEIENDNLERRERELNASLQDVTDKLNRLLEENAWITTELDEQKAITSEQMERMKEEMRDLQSELMVVTTKQPSTFEIPDIMQATSLECNSLSNGTATSSVGLVDDMLMLISEMEKRLVRKQESG